MKVLFINDRLISSCCFYSRLFFVMAVLVAALGRQVEAELEGSELFALDIEELMDIQVTVVAKKEQKVSDTPAAISVITAEDIRRSGARSIPELLRMVPGLHVAQSHSSNWSISTRGFGGLFANKLLVLMDGRSIYTPLFSGVYWDTQDTFLADIERIEVIRGPGASVWGANAVNGVINIITKSSKDTTDKLIVAGAGTEERGFISARSGFSMSEQTTGRVFVKYFDRDNSERIDGTGSDDQWDMLRGGARFDIEASSKDRISILMDVYGGDKNEELSFASSLPPFTTTSSREADLFGASILGRWVHDHTNGSSSTVQFYVDHNSRDALDIDQEINTFDLDLQNNFELNAWNQIVWGLNYRITSDDIESGSEVIFSPEDRTYSLVSGFIQDEITVIEDQLTLYVGTKVEHNDFSGTEVQPSARLLWNLAKDHTLWSSFSRAVRTPSRANDDIRINAASFPGPDGSINQVSIFGDRNFDSEELLAYEAGYRGKLSRSFIVDLALFYNDYDQLISSEMGAPFFEFTPAPGQLVLPSSFANLGSGQTHGVELLLDFQAYEWLRVQTWYSYLDVNLDLDSSSTDLTFFEEEGKNAQHQVSFRPMIDLSDNLELDSAFRYVDRLSSTDIDAYIDLTVRLAWQVTENLTLSLVGQNLLHDEHIEYRATARPVTEAELERAFYGQLTLNLD